MTRRIYHHYDLPHLDRDDRQMCGRLALLIGAAFATACLWGIVVLIAKLLATALVVVQ